VLLIGGGSAPAPTNKVLRNTSKGMIRITDPFFSSCDFLFVQGLRLCGVIFSKRMTSRLHRNQILSFVMSIGCLLGGAALLTSGEAFQSIESTYAGAALSSLSIVFIAIGCCYRFQLDAHQTFPPPSFPPRIYQIPGMSSGMKKNKSETSLELMAVESGEVGVPKNQTEN